MQQISSSLGMTSNHFITQCVLACIAAIDQEPEPDVPPFILKVRQALQKPRSLLDRLMSHPVNVAINHWLAYPIFRRKPPTPKQVEWLDVLCGKVATLVMSALGPQTEAQYWRCAAASQRFCYESILGTEYVKGFTPLKEWLDRDQLDALERALPFIDSVIDDFCKARGITNHRAVKK